MGICVVMEGVYCRVGKGTICYQINLLSMIGSETVRLIWGECSGQPIHSWLGLRALYTGQAGSVMNICKCVRVCVHAWIWKLGVCSGILY